MESSPSSQELLKSTACVWTVYLLNLKWSHFKIAEHIVYSFIPKMSTNEDDSRTNTKSWIGVNYEAWQSTRGQKQGATNSKWTGNVQKLQSLPATNFIFKHMKH